MGDLSKIAVVGATPAMIAAARQGARNVTIREVVDSMHQIELINPEWYEKAEGKSGQQRRRERRKEQRSWKKKR